MFEGQHIVVFLRSFVDDEGLARIPRVREAEMHGPWAASTDTEEQQLAQAVAPFGPMVALGRPGDRLPQAGAERHYSSDLEWQRQVLSALGRASLVLLACGPGRSLRWEVEQVVSLNRPERFVLVVVRDAGQYESFRRAMQDVFPKGLPPSGSERKQRTGSLERVEGPDTYIRDAIWFDVDWTPHLTPLGSLDPGVDVFRLIDRFEWVKTAFPLAIRPVFGRAGLNPQGLPSGRLPRPAVVKVAVTLIAVGWGSFLIAVGWGGFLASAPLLAFLGLPAAGMLQDLAWRALCCQNAQNLCWNHGRLMCHIVASC
ncbi:hypothetical protein [Streptomyces sp. NPDC005732]|uniref:hypothetical protein n=1 Tax=Streptomyces sp. NPDC005732 TaxID=3157057 RepID=UPI0033D14345